MPKIRIRESDNTGYSSAELTNNVVYIPGKASVANGPKLYNTPKAFQDDVEDGLYDKDDLSAKLAYHLLNLGMRVVYQGFELDSTESGGIAKPNIDWKVLEDKNLWPVRFLTTGGYYCPSADMIMTAAKRCDAVALLDTREVEVVAVRSEIEKIVEAAIAAGDVIKEKDDDATFTQDVSSFAAAFVPSIVVKLHNLADELEECEIPASFGYLIAYATSVKSNPVWYAAAGSFRGVIPGFVETNDMKKYTRSDCEILQARSSTSDVELDGEGDNVGIAINPIAYERPFGYLVWGNRTTRKNEADEVTGVGILKATSFLNCRVLSTEIAKVAYESAVKYTFEQNTAILWANFTNPILSLIEKMITGNGILDGSITPVATDKKARLACKISLVPIEPVEDYDIEIELTDSIVIAE